MKSSYRVGATLVGAATFTVGATVTVGSPASADVPNLSPALCNGQPYGHAVGKYSNPGHDDVPLRCGDAAHNIGIYHILKKHPVNSTVNTKIQNTFTYGEQKDPGAKVLFDENCTAIFIVAYGYNAYNGNDQNANPVGIITAYDPREPVVTVATAAAAASPNAFGQNCPIIVPIGD
jgi:hypothetical protein